MLCMRSLCFAFLLVCSSAAWAQSSSSSANSSEGNSQSPDRPSSSSSSEKAPSAPTPNLEPPRSDRVNADALPDTPGESSSKDTQIDLSPPPENNATRRPGSPNSAANAETTSDTDVGEMHPWDPHKAAKDVEVGDFYFKQKNYAGAESRYREALEYKDNDAIATFRLAVCLEKMDRPGEAREEYESYLRILPHGPQAADAKKAIERLNSPSAKKYRVPTTEP